MWRSCDAEQCVDRLLASMHIIIGIQTHTKLPVLLSISLTTSSPFHDYQMFSSLHHLRIVVAVGVVVAAAGEVVVAAVAVAVALIEVVVVVGVGAAVGLVVGVV